MLFRSPIVDSNLTKTGTLEATTISGSNTSKQRISFDTNDIEFYENNVEAMSIRDSSVKINPQVGDVDFQAFSSNGTELIHANAGTHTLETAGILDVTNTTDSSDATGDTGALRVEGGASIAKKVFVGTDLDVGGTYTNNTQPAFLALNSGTDNNLAINTDVKIEFNSEVYDQANNFNNSTDTFTAPVTGKYLLTTQLRLDDIDTAADWVSIRIVTDNREYRRFIDPNFSADLNQFGMNMTVVADMDANDTAHVEFRQSGGSAQVDSESGNPGLSPPQLDTFFSGYLLG